MRELSVEARQTFLDQLAAGETVVVAAGDEPNRRRFYRLREDDPEFAAAWRTAYQEGTDALVKEAQRRAVEGIEEPVYYKGEIVGHIRRHDSTLLMFLIKQRDPTYRENSKVELTGGDGKPVEVKVEHTVVDLARVLGLLGSAGVLGARPAADTPGDEVHTA